MSNRILTGFEPNKVFHYFEDLCTIPHGSGNTKALSDYCVAFAKEHGLRYVQDESNNVVIFAPGSAGYENHPPVILQGHMDMVCTKVPECTLDMEKEGLQLEIVDGHVCAKGTSLGGDDGIALAYALAIMDDPTIAHPPIEAVFTVDEEVGLVGAAALDCSILQGRLFLNLDASEEGVMTVGCAGGCRCDIVLPVASGHSCGVNCQLTLEGFAGGHSGGEIHRGLANPIKLMGEILHLLSLSYGIQLQAIHGGSQDNAIPRETTASFLISEDVVDAARNEIESWWAQAKIPYEKTDANGTCVFKKNGEVCGSVMTAEDTAKAAKLICDLPNGVQAMSKEIAGLVETSLNIGIVRLEQDHFRLTASVRSSVKTSLSALVEQLRSISEGSGATFATRGAYPPWEYRKESPLRDLLVKIYREQTGQEMVVRAIHAGLECGLFSDKLPGLDCISYGPNLHDIHTPRERMDIASVARTWDFFLKVLASL